MPAVIRKQIEELTDEELKEVLRRDYLRKLTRQHGGNNSYVYKI